MKLTRKQLNRYILEELNRLSELEEEKPDEQEDEQMKLKTMSMSGAGFGKAGREDRLSANPELSPMERGIVQQIDEFLLDLAQLEGVELNNRKVVITRLMKMLEKAIAPKQQGAQE